MMSASTLRTELLNLDPTDSEPTARQRLTDAYGVFATDAKTAVTSVPITSAGVNLGKAAMEPALTGMSVDPTPGTVITAGVIAFWGAVALGLATSFAGATAIVPPPNAGLIVALGPIFVANMAGGLSKSDSMLAIATAMHVQAIIGGTVTLPIPATEPII